MGKIISETSIKELKLFKRGKVRDVYTLDEQLLIISTDRISAFDVILPNPIPDKGATLTKLSTFWFSKMSNVIANHLITTKEEEFPEICHPYINILKDRTMLVRKAKPMPVECIVRGYISGSGWKEYKQGGTVCRLKLPAGLKESEKLNEPLFTPSTKAEEGHDVNISFEECSSIVGKEVAEKLRHVSIELYTKAASYAEKRGIIIADTKFEFGLSGDEIILIDEALTPDSSRFWSVDNYEPGRGQDSFDKQIVRDYLLTLDWDKTYPGPILPSEIIDKTSRRYKEILRILTE